jgi:hypothetical protein
VCAALRLSGDVFENDFDCEAMTSFFPSSSATVKNGADEIE